MQPSSLQERCIFLHQYNNNNIRVQRCNSTNFTISSLRREPSPTRTLKWFGRYHVQITYCNTSSSYHMQHIEPLSRATCHVMCHVVRRDSSAIQLDLKSHLLELYFVGWTINRWRRGGNRSTRRKPLATSFRKCHILKPEDSSPKRDSYPHNSISGRLGKETC